MKSTWVNQDKKEFVVSDVFKENILLMDLTAQPTEIRECMDKTIADGEANPGTFSLFHMTRFLGANDLVRISQHMDNFK